MAKLTRIFGAYVKAEVPEPFGVVKNPERWCRDAEALESEIKRHCDNLQNTSIELEIENICEFCRSPWTEDSEAYNGGCCSEDKE